MASILGRFKDIMSSNINAMLDKAEDPEKMIDQYLRNMERDLRDVKAETAAVMAEESATKRKVIECEGEVKKMEDYAKKALQAGNETDARLFLEKKQAQSDKLQMLEKNREIAVNNAAKMRQMHDKLQGDIQEMSARRNEIKSKMKMAKTSQKINEMSSVSKLSGSMSGFEAMEDKANRMMDEAEATMELNRPQSDEMEDLMKKYEGASEQGNTQEVEDELERLRKELNQ